MKITKINKKKTNNQKSICSLLNRLPNKKKQQNNYE